MLARYRTVTFRPARHWLAAAALLTSLHAQAGSGDLAIGFNSGYITRGIMLGDGAAALQFSANYYDDTDGWFGGVSGGTLGASWTGSQIMHMQGRFGRALRLSGDWGVQAAYAYYAYPLDAELNSAEHDEASLSVAYRDIAYLSLVHQGVKPWNMMGHRLGTAVEAVLRRNLGLTIDAIAGLGYTMVDDSVSRGYAYGHLGIAWRIAAVEAAVFYVVTSSRAESLYGGMAADRWAGSVAWNF